MPRCGAQAAAAVGGGLSLAAAAKGAIQKFQSQRAAWSIMCVASQPHAAMRSWQQLLGSLRSFHVCLLFPHRKLSALSAPLNADVRQAGRLLLQAKPAAASCLTAAGLPGHGPAPRLLLI